jgi:lysophospholipase L1-like esterase
MFHRCGPRHAGVGELSGAYAEVAASLDIPYFDLYRHLINDPAWPGMYEKNDGVQPIAAGYDIIGEHIFNWDAERAWFD